MSTLVLTGNLALINAVQTSQQPELSVREFTALVYFDKANIASVFCNFSNKVNDYWNALFGLSDYISSKDSYYIFYDTPTIMNHEAK